MAAKGLKGPDPERAERGQMRGILVLLKNHEDGVERVVFATARRCPALLEHLKKIRALDKEIDQLVFEGQAAAAEITDAKDPDLILKIGKAAIDKADKLEDLRIARGEEIMAFYAAGLRGAGYTDEDVDKYLELFDVEHYDELQYKVRIGCGRADFFSERSPAARS